MYLLFSLRFPNLFLVLVGGKKGERGRGRKKKLAIIIFFAGNLQYKMGQKAKEDEEDEEEEKFRIEINC